MVCIASEKILEVDDDGIEAVGQHIKHLSTTQQTDIVALMVDYPELFQNIHGCTTIAIHDVDTGSTLPVKQHPYRLGPVTLKRVEEELECMIRIGGVEPSQSEWSSPVVLVPKPDGTSRLCIDYRKVNQIIKTDAFPIPRIEDCTDCMGKVEYVTKLDLLKGYWQVPFTPQAQEVTAFLTPGGLYKCKVLPFGMKNAPATFQRAMNTLIVGLTNVVVYIDDVVVYSGSWSDHLRHLRELFCRLQQAKLVVNLLKCEIGKGQVTYL